MKNEAKITEWKVGDKVSVPQYINKNQKRKILDFRHGTIIEKCKNNFFRVSIKTISENYNECFFEEDMFTEEQENLIKIWR